MPHAHRRLVAMLTCSWAAIAMSAQDPLILIDVGHTLQAPGARSARGVAEFWFNLELASAVDDALRAQSLTTRLVNPHGTVAGLAERTVQSEDAALFLSIHHDSVQAQYLNEWVHAGAVQLHSERSRGFSLFVSRRNPAASDSLRCASAIGRALLEAGFVPSRHHAEPIPGEGRPFADETNGVHYFDELVVLRAAQSPAVLLEAGVIVHRDEELMLQQEDTRRTIAQAVGRGVLACLGPRG